ncbi:hypothetical protein N7495_001359 [Penicillium taxi]|uniref:uncharacterized protein n=1 Tax=Penicillium taxi TaxID=168475 RepID=UPI002545AAD2|nr:uncharacterized protein N7495_001359 [Penicillium taxi]KAJ5908677.1 hypothetical protein N7495_001359 [Penicillium taxi]
MFGIIGPIGQWNIDDYHGPSKDIIPHAAKSRREEIMITTHTTYANNKASVGIILIEKVEAQLTEPNTKLEYRPLHNSKASSK